MFGTDLPSAAGLVLCTGICLHRRGAAQLGPTFSALLHPILAPGSEHQTCRGDVDTEHRAAHRGGGFADFRDRFGQALWRVPLSGGPGTFFSLVPGSVSHARTD